ncbi:helix-turn-helix domain-containing protein, partial [Ruthenibacterium lactatiformans]|nr:helix-turn-helix domain-containing protein [Ruthenibacterium lactatiformans]MTS40065.1 helix-turn-helix domain-containing protein [Ruthenibacterium lactatiformans]MTS43805.1 helix-turn-helix domain-containing protein [Ruthenibacterium lactatiformans]MTS79341.1 helix-turn-helix domain-containing protein [Ruthenibacterium lactatiformans]
MVTVGTRLRIIRKDAGLSQVELRKLAGSNQSAINRYETDRAAVPYRML